MSNSFHLTTIEKSYGINQCWRTNGGKSQPVNYELKANTNFFLYFSFGIENVVVVVVVASSAARRCFKE